MTARGNLLSIPRLKNVLQPSTMLRYAAFVYSLLLFIGFVLVALSAYTLVNVAAYRENQQRYNEIIGIYQSLNLGDSYTQTTINVFGSKRTGTVSANHTESSSIVGGHNDTPVNTIKDLTAKITAAGFEAMESKQTNTVAPLYSFRNADGAYILLTVSPAAYQNKIMYNQPIEQTNPSEDMKQAPSYYKILVNLDDSGEWGNTL